MAEPNPDTWAQSHKRRLALSRWDNEGGASASRPVAGSTGPTLRHGIWPRVDIAELKRSKPLGGPLLEATPGRGPST
jgi:hypothetical protein